MNISNRTPSETLEWLLDQADPGARYLTLRDICRLPAADPELGAARLSAHRLGPIATVLANMHPEGYWEQTGAGYFPKYTGAVWSLILLAQLGAHIDMDDRIQTACNYLLDHALTPAGQFGVSGTPSSTADCLQGNLCAALLDLGVPPQRLAGAFEWLARSVTGEGIAPKEDKRAALRYYAGKCGPRFACGSNDHLPCAWGGVKVMLALSKWPVELRNPLFNRAVQIGVDFFLEVDPALAAYPNGYAAKSSGNWWKFGFPVFYVSDILQIIEALAGLGLGQDERLANALKLVESKQRPDGTWALEYDYAGKTWVDFGKKNAPNRWVTLRALRALQSARSPHAPLGERAL
jgi:hypothetical protein